MSNIKLYSYYLSSASYRVRIALELKKLPYEIIAIDLYKGNGEQFNENYGDVNPLHQVPTLEIDNMTFTQSISIIEYLDEVFTSGARFLPTDPLLRAQVRCIAEIINSGIQPLQNVRVLKAIPGNKKAWAQKVVMDGFKALEPILTKTSGRYCVGDEITIADIFLVPQVYNARRFQIDINEFPQMSRIYNTLCQHEAFEKANPNVQPDCPENEREKHFMKFYDFNAAV